ncbi:50S ribosomal protein L33 [Planococcus salinus]|uniref:Large ribosomal subunit protein bL33 n=1 Tax=Planococcus salinus TaxID=1848460 RepID=A0A3M8P4R4_9BACL|nr:50S ribosomal protein L33 [Planococcus salinus]RNF38653.1 50S ribosomal protein L33 [Planococcus salinus]
MAKKIVLSCSKCASRNYAVPSKAESGTRLVLKKFCAYCNEHTEHKQTV